MRKSANTPPAESAQERDQRICKELRREKMQELRIIEERLSAENVTEEEKEELQQDLEALSVEPLRQLKITLSWGGPSDGFLLVFEGVTHELVKGYYWYADWFTYAEEALSREEASLVNDLYLGGDPTVYFETTQP